MGVNGIYGLSGSGLDIESMVKVGMMGKQKQLDSLQQKTDLATWKKEAMSSVYSDLSTMNYSTLSQYKLQSNMNAMSATSSDESIVKVTANGSAASMTHKVSVGGLSSNAYLITGDQITRANTSAGKSIYLADSLFSTGNPKTGDGNTIYNLGDKTYVGKQQVGSYTEYSFPNTGSSRSSLNLKKTIDASGISYEKQIMYNGTPEPGYENYVPVTDEDEIAAYERLINKTSSEELVNYYWGQPTVTGEYTEYSFNTVDGKSETLTFTNVDKSNPATTTYDKTYKDSAGTAHTLDVDYIEHDFSNLVDSDKFVSNGRIVSDDDIAISFTVMDGTEKDKSAEELAELKAKNTITYTYGQLTSSGKTYNDIVADINALGLNVKAGYDAANDTFSLTNKNSGADNKISLTMNTELAATLFNNLGLKQSRDGELSSISAFAKDTTNTTAGTSGSITIDGKTYNNVEDNRITVDGVTYQLQNVSASDNSGKTYNFTGTDAEGKAITGSLTEASGAAKTVNVVINQNTDAIIEKVKSFVEDYNKMLDGLYEKYSETKYSDYKPLTDSQRDKMTEKQIEKWEEKAKSGLLYHDRTIGNIIDKMRAAVSTPVEGLDSKYNSAYSIGIYTSKTNGHISLDEDRLKKALSEDPEAAYKIFGSLPESDSKGNYDYDKMGVAQRLGDVMVQAMKNVKTEAGDSTELSDGSNLGNKILEFQQKMSDFKTLMSAFESRLFKKYDAMESLLATLGAQMNYITGGQ